MTASGLRRGLTLYELNVFVLLIGILLLTALRFTASEQTVVQTLKDHTLSFFVLESAKNQVLAAVTAGEPLDERARKTLVSRFPLPPFLEFSADFPAFLASGSARTVTLRMSLPKRGLRPAKVLEREVRLP